MKSIRSILLLSLLSLMACAPSHRHYATYDDYPEYKGNDLGITYTAGQSQFRAWSPAADEVKLHIYDAPLNTEPIASYDMKSDVDGTWLYTIGEDLIGKYYAFQIKFNGEWLDPTPGIWAKAVGVNGERGAVVDMATTNPQEWADDVRPELISFTDAVIYELHYRDLTISPTSGSHYNGKFLGLAERGTVSPDGLSTGLDHIIDLGVTHVQLLPSYDYGSIDETTLNDNVYNWGYDPKNYNVPEGGYSTDPYSPTARIVEMKTMIQTLHSAGIRVIMDVVYNHTFVGAESHLNLMAPGYFYRMENDTAWSNGSGCGNETASERAMMRRFMVESVKYWIEEYHIDGFRFDLMGIHDIETMRAIRSAVDEIDPSITIHGEGWAAGSCAITEEIRAVKANVSQMDGIAVFSDDIRDAMRGNWVEGNRGGFLVGRTDFDESIRFGVVGATAHPAINQDNIVHSSSAYATSPAQVINYVSCHDDPCLVDKLRAIEPNLTTAELIRMELLAQTIVFTSQGVPFIFSGEELLRDKKGVHNTYQSPDSVNQIDWHNKALYHEVYSYIRSLIAMRRSHPAFRMNSAAMVADAINFLPTENGVVAYTIDGTAMNDEWSTIVVIYNGNRTAITQSLPIGTWSAACYDARFIPYNASLTFTDNITLPPTSAAVLYVK